MYCVLLRALSHALPRLHLDHGVTLTLLLALHFIEGDTQSQSAQGLNTGHQQHRSLSPCSRLWLGYLHPSLTLWPRKRKSSTVSKVPPSEKVTQFSDFLGTTDMEFTLCPISSRVKCWQGCLPSISPLGRWPLLWLTTLTCTHPDAFRSHRALIGS